MRLTGLVLTLSLTLAPLAATAQQPVKAPRIGMLLSGTLVDPDPRVAALREALRGRGYVDGQNIAIDPLSGSLVEPPRAPNLLRSASASLNSTLTSDHASSDHASALQRVRSITRMMRLMPAHFLES